MKNRTWRPKFTRGESSALVILLVVGFVFVLLSVSEWLKSVNVLARSCEIVGIACWTAASIELLFVTFIRKEFRSAVKSDLTQVMLVGFGQPSPTRSEMMIKLAELEENLEDLCSKCRVVGIGEVFPNELAYRNAHPIEKELAEPTRVRKVVCIGRSLTGLLTSGKDAIQEALRMKVDFEFAILNPETANDPMMKRLVFLGPNHIKHGLDKLAELDTWYQKQSNKNALGHVSVRLHTLYLPDTFLGYFWKDDSKTAIYWTHFYDDSEKKKPVVALHGDSLWGRELTERFKGIWDNFSSAEYEIAPSVDKAKSIVALVQRFEQAPNGQKRAEISSS